MLPAWIRCRACGRPTRNQQHEGEFPLDYRVDLDVYHGPLDLLLYLIRRDELDIYDIPISRILDSYMHYLGELKQLKDAHAIDINVAGEFLVMAATLMEIKSAMLLPRHETAGEPGEKSVAEDLADPRYELVQKLLEYKRLKDSAAGLERKRAEHDARFPRFPARIEGSDEPPPIDLDEVQVWDLLAAFSRLMAEVGQRKPKYHEVTYDDTPIDLHAADIEDRVKREKRLTLRSLIVGRKNKSEMIGVFLALLELVREKRVLVHVVGDTTEFHAEPAQLPQSQGDQPRHKSRRQTATPPSSDGAAQSGASPHTGESAAQNTSAAPGEAALGEAAPENAAAPGASAPGESTRGESATLGDSTTPAGSTPGADIVIEIAPEWHRKTFAHASLGLAPELEAAPDPATENPQAADRPADPRPDTEPVALSDAPRAQSASSSGTSTESAAD